ncbi:related to WD repeat-containing protein [Ramularia collo-cygni]|uniref:Related to WD repeat-containing protein n=1 Tax=Ramularia collo-cygni TaxID=112498 RepID=A0A2D3V3Y6_9PEZI|nr:related to WD repeat-containing protein [Ramularia collo-cygni]CZT22683.1 related to WD repeat-containing protein [Ramularia collo-cygni]
MKDSLISKLYARELSPGLGRTSRSYRPLYSSRNLIDELDITHELGGHSGCVNALAWSKGGDLLASGSDDQHLNIHRYQPNDDSRQFQLSATVATGHTQNIFSVKFMPHSNDSVVITAAGDGEVRVFDINHMGQATEASRASRMASEGRRRGRDSLYNGVRYLTDGNTNCRVYRSHGDRVKRIVTESSPHLFLTCSEDGEVRQWDMRQPSSAYPRPRGGRFTTQEVSLPPPLISYKRYGLDLNTISCSASQPHYIALGGSHLHAFLHDRRMTGRDLLKEAGRPLSPIDQMSPEEQDLLSQATQCVRKFAPKGQQKMKRSENGHITALKISDARPDEMIVSWSGDHIYSFDLVRDNPAKKDETVAVDQRRKRKRQANGSEGARTRQDALRIRYQNGQSEDIPLSSNASEQQSLSSRQRDAQRTAKVVIKIRASMFGSDESASDPTARFTTCIGQAASILSDMDQLMRDWGYPLDPDPEQVYVQQTLRRNRESCRRFVQAAGTLSRVLGGRIQTPSPSGTSPMMAQFAEIETRNSDLELTDKERFGYDFIKAILLWLESGIGRLIEGFTRPEQCTTKSGLRLPIPEADATVEAIDEYLIPYLHSLATEEPIVNLDINQFEVDANQVIFTEQEAVQAFSAAVKIPFADLSAGIVEAEGGGYITTQDRQTAQRFWARKVARGVLFRVAGGLSHGFVDRAFGGSGRETQTGEERLGLLGEQEEDEEEEQMSGVEIVDADGRVVDGANAEDIASLAQAVADDEDEDDDDEVDEVDDLDDEHDDEIHMDDDNDDDDDDEDDDNQSDDSSSPSEEDGVPNIGRGPRSIYGSAFSRRNLRSHVEASTPCSAPTRQYRGHCNVRTVKDVNYFGPDDEYVVSGSDDGNFFIWDRKTSELVNVLEGDGEVVNVIQGHPYECMLAVSGIDHTIKIFGADARARERARLGQGTEAHDPESFSSIAWPMRIGRRTVRRRTSGSEPTVTAEEQAAMDVDEDDGEDYVAPNGLSSRRRMHDSYRIMQANNVERESGSEEAYISLPHAQLLQLLLGQLGNAGAVPTFLH